MGASWHDKRPSGHDALLFLQRMNIRSGDAVCGGYASAPNTDGFNVGGHRITIVDSTVHNGDDCIPVTSGNDGTTTDVYVGNIRCMCGTNGGVVYDQGGKVSNVTFDNIYVYGTNQGAGVKLSRPGRNATGGRVANVVWKNVRIDRPRNAALYFNVFQEDAPWPCKGPADPALRAWLSIENVLFQNVTATLIEKSQPAGCFLCTPGAPCTATFDAVSIRGADGKLVPAYACENLKETSHGGSMPDRCRPVP